MDKQLSAVSWSDFDTAYGPATDLPGQLRRLAGPDLPDALAARHELWCSLCHQHVFVSTAAVPALPFILGALDVAGPQLTIEILDILLGFARCTKDAALKATEESYPVPEWLTVLSARMAAERGRFEVLTRHPNPEARQFAQDILNELDQ